MLYDKSISSVREDEKRIGLFSLALPLLLEYLFQQLYGTVNTLILSGYSDNAVSAVGVAQQIICIADALLNMVSKGAVIITSVALGAKYFDRARAVAGSGLLLAGFGSAGIGILVALCAAPLMLLMHLTGEVHGLAVEYLTLAALTFPIKTLMSYFNNLLICHGYSRLSMVSGIISNVLNLLLAWIALYSGIELPVRGVSAVAVCSAIAQLVGLVFSVVCFSVRRCPFRLCCKRHQVMDILRLGVPAGVSVVAYNFSCMVTTSFITGLGVRVINTKLYISNILAYTSRFSYSIGNAGGILMGRHRGAGRMDSVNALYWQNIRIAVGLNAALALCILAFYRPLLSIFTNDSEILAAALPIMAVDVLLEMLRAVNHVSESALNANGEVKIPLVTSVLSGWGVNVLGSYLLAVHFGMGLMGIWIAMMLDEATKATVYLLCWRGGKWRTAQV